MHFSFGLDGSGKAVLGGLLVIGAPIIVLYLVLSPFASILGRF